MVWGAIGAAMAGGAATTLDYMKEQASADLLEQKEKRLMERQFELQERSNTAADARLTKQETGRDRRAADERGSAERRHAETETRRSTEAKAEYDARRAYEERLFRAQTSRADRDDKSRETREASESRRAMLGSLRDQLTAATTELKIAEAGGNADEVAAVRGRISSLNLEIDVTRKAIASQHARRASSGGGSSDGGGEQRSILEGELRKAQEKLLRPLDFMSPEERKSDPDGSTFRSRIETDIASLNKELGRTGGAAGSIGAAMDAAPDPADAEREQRRNAALARSPSRTATRQNQPLSGLSPNSQAAERRTALDAEKSQRVAAADAEKSQRVAAAVAEAEFILASDDAKAATEFLTTRQYGELDNQTKGKIFRLANGVK